jgi:acyl-CoA reductase-like NAD-dependent aldehyde dehydrogenase
MFYKHARVEYHPLGVVGAIVPWNYPFHNIFNPLSAALFAGNAIVIKARPLPLQCLGWGVLFLVELCKFPFLFRPCCLDRLTCTLH